ncbi:MAG: VOC family protein [Acidimicrobiia bacterium]
MTEFTKHAPGTFSWIELATTDTEAAKAFYSALFGWEHEDVPAGEAGTYTMLRLGGRDVAALNEQPKEQRSQGIPPHWTSYVTVADVEESAANVKSLGGTVHVEPFDVMEVGRMAVIQDPTGAFFALWEPKTHIGLGIANVSGALTWNELLTNDTDAAAKFYTGLFGWDAQTREIPETTYTTFMRGERPAAGMMAIPEHWGDVPPYWGIYFAVDDCDAAATRIKDLGGEIRVPPTDAPEAGRFASAVDPQGAGFAIIRLANPPG